MTTEGTRQSFRMLTVRTLSADISREMLGKPTMPLADVFAGLYAAVAGTLPQDNAIAAVKLPLLLQAFAHLHELDRKMDPKRWTASEIEAWARRELLAETAFRILREAEG